MLKGYRTVITNILVLAFSVLAMFGLDVTAEDQGYILSGVLALANVGLRLITNTAYGTSEEVGQTTRSKSQAGFIRLPVTAICAFLSILMLCLAAGCSILKDNPLRPIADCVSIEAPSNDTIGACYASVTMLAGQIDNLADAGVIESALERELLAHLDDAMQLLVTTQTLISSDPEDAAESLKLVQALLLILQEKIPERSNL